MRSIKRRASLAVRVAAVILALLAALSLCGCQKGSDVPLSPGLKMIEGVPVYDDDVAMRTDHFTVTPGMMAFFFYDYGGEMITVMEQSKTFDYSLSLHDQIYTDGLSWYEVIMNATLEKVSTMLIYCEAAYAAGVALTAEQSSAIDSEISSATMEAAAAYSMSLEEYCQALYGPLMTAADLRSVLELEMLANAYSLTVTAELEGSITESAAREYAATNGLTDETPSRNIAYIAVPYVNGAANDSKVTAILAALAQAPREETLSAYTADGTVGSEKNLTPDNTNISAISDWLFAPGRASGDSGRIEAGSYTYVLLYTGNGMSYAEVSARMSLYDSAYAAWYNGWVERLEFGYNYDVT